MSFESASGRIALRGVVFVAVLLSLLPQFVPGKRTRLLSVCSWIYSARFRRGIANNPGRDRSGRTCLMGADSAEGCWYCCIGCMLYCTALESSPSLRSWCLIVRTALFLFLSLVLPSFDLFQGQISGSVLDRAYIGQTDFAILTVLVSLNRLDRSLGSGGWSARQKWLRGHRSQGRPFVRTTFACLFACCWRCFLDQPTSTRGTV